MCVAIPVQMIAGEQEPVLEQEATMAGGMAGRRNRHEPRCQFVKIVPVKDDLGLWLRGQLLSMNHTFRPEMPGELVSISDIVSMRQEDA